MEKKQTAVQFIHETMNMRRLSMHQFDKLFEQALQMEREQIEEAFKEGYDLATNEAIKEIRKNYTQTFNQ